MNAIIKFKNKTISTDVKGVEFSCGITMLFQDEKQSMPFFHQLRETGLRCYHTGNNAPCGPSVMVYSYDKSDFQIKIGE